MFGRIDLSPGGIPIYAIVRSGGRQYRVEPDQTLDVNLLTAEVGSTVDLSVLMLAGDGKTEIGTPLLKKARVVAEVIEHGRGSKILVFKYKNKTRYRRRYGHRQDYTRLAIKQIVSEAGVVTKSEERKRPRKLEVTVEPEEAPATEATAEVVEAAPKPRRARTPKIEPEEAPPTEATAEVVEAAPKPRRARAPKAEAEAPAAEAAADAPASEKPARRKRAPKAETEGE
jgi:large subunit ribosomal protein L21